MGLGILSQVTVMAQTNRHNNLGAQEHLWKMKKISAHEFIGVGNSGSVVKYNDSCNDWLPLPAGTSNDDFRNISFPTGSTGYISGPANAFYKTTNGGTSWTAIPASITGLTNASIQCVHFRTATTGFIAGSQIGVSGGGRFIKKTTDGGLTWTTVTPAAGMGTSTVYDMAFFAADTGIAVATNNQAFRTTDNGNTWTAVATPATVYSVAVAGANTAIAVANGNIIRSTDRGLTWASVSGAATGMQGVHFYDDTHGMITGSAGAVLYTSDAGLTWTAIPTLLSQKLYDVQMTSATTAVAVGAEGQALSIDINQPFHRLFEEHFCHPTDSMTYTRYTNTDNSLAAPARKWFFTNVNESENGLEAAGWFPGKFAIYDAYYYEEVRAQHHSDSAFIETRSLNLAGTTQLSLDWNEAFYTHPDGLTRTRVQGFNGTDWITLYQSNGLDMGDGVASAVFPDHKRAIDISALAGVANAKLRFSYAAPNTNDGLKNFWAVSDIVISNRSVALQLDSLNAAGNGNVTECLPIAAQDIKVKMSNTGNLGVFPVELGWSSSDGQAGKTGTYGELAATSSANYVLIDNFTPPAAGGAITIKAWIRNMPNQNAVNDTITKTFYFTPDAGTTALLGNDTAICPGGSYTLHAPATLNSPLWSDGSNAASYTVNGAGTYWLQGVYGTTCAVSDTIHITLINVPVPVITATGDLLQVGSNVYASYQWFRNNVALPNSNSAQIVVTQAGSYTVKAITAAGCEVISTAYIYNPGGTGTKDLQIEKGMLILFPNPALTEITAYTGDESGGKYQVTIIDIIGKNILNSVFHSKTNSITFDVSNLSPGVYQVILSNEKQNRTGRFVKK
ncbi:putative secreted protein (Por secretion system target) [Taibaiella chishuiensis]|uniref:Putative secreted protein (Por secretion system target) n=2 Tax=Taibaiella chishuiensis TaxID=1434707 RepID=A0A2P8DAV4_9BACT|nr:putative secreted protein (Por secretion system target) [Taibaiella chishuiensis]